MRKGFTLIELMIVIAIISIIAGIAIPNLLESRISSQESGAATALKSGLLPAQVQFQAGGYVDLDGDGVGVYSTDGAATNPYDMLSGAEATPTGITLNLLAPTYRGADPTISSYVFSDPVTETEPTGSDDGTGERTWASTSYPQDNNSGRRWFSINQAGNVYSTRPSSTAFTAGSASTAGDVFGDDMSGNPSATDFIPYRR